MAELINLIIDRAVFFDIGIRTRHISLWLVIIVVRHEILNRIIRKKLLELAVELTGKGFVVGDDKRWLVFTRNHLTHGIGLPSSRCPQQDLRFLTIFDTLTQGLNRCWLVTRRLIL